MKSLSWLIMLSLICLSGAALADYDASKLQALFTDRQQRMQIDALRSGSRTEGKTRQTSKVRLSGYMTRSDGKSVVWVNDGNTLDSPKVDDLHVHKDSVGRDKRVKISADGKSRSLRPGEVWLKETGKVMDHQ